MIAITPRGERHFVLQSDRQDHPEEPEKWTAFRIRDLSERERVRIADSSKVSYDPMTGSYSEGTGTRVYLLCKLALIGVLETHPLRDESGCAIPFQTDKATGQVSDAWLERLGWQAKVDISNAILYGLTMTEDEKKKLAPPPSPVTATSSLDAPKIAEE